ncbi:MAG: hypothetical protein HY935_04725 [Nitrosomonadales bacterium]|nr:hypothetical protein [Nitrosomonadales bacterium]
MRKLKPTFGNGFASGTAAAFDFGTSPHGLSAGLPLPVQEIPEAASLGFPAEQVLTLEAGAVAPKVYRSSKVRRICRSIRASVAKLAPKDVHYLRLTEVEFLHVYTAVEQDRSRTYKAIRKGIADLQDLRASDSLWQALQDVQARRLKKAWRL